MRPWIASAVDKPDMRFGMELRAPTDAVRGSGFRVFADVVAAGGVVKGIAVPAGGDRATSAGSCSSASAQSAPPSRRSSSDRRAPLRR